VNLVSPLRGPAALWRAVELFRARRRLLLMLFLAPWTISAVIFLGSWSLLTKWLTARVDLYLERFVGAWWDPILTGFGTFVAVLVAGALAYLVTVIGATLVSAPFHDRLSAATETAVRLQKGNAGGPETLQTGSMGLLKSLREGAKTAVVLLAVEIALLPLQFFVGVGHLIFIFATAFVLTLGLLDVPLARHELTLGQKAAFVARNAGAIFGLSLAVLVIAFLPLVNLLAIPLIVMATTLLVVDSEISPRR